MIKGLNKGVQAWRVKATEYLNETQRRSLEEARETINVDTGAAARSLDSTPARQQGLTIRSEFNAGDDSINPKSKNTKTSVYVPILERRFQTVLTPHLQKFLQEIQRGLK